MIMVTASSAPPIIVPSTAGHAAPMSTAPVLSAPTLVANNANPLRDTRARPATPQAETSEGTRDVQMDQIRDLLIGEFRSEIDARLSVFDARLSALERGLQAARAEDDAKRRAAFDDLAKGVAALAAQISGGAKL